MQKNELITAEQRIKCITEFLIKYFDEHNIDRKYITTYKQIEDMNLQGCKVSLQKATFTKHKFTTKDIMKAINPTSLQTEISFKLENFNYFLKATDTINISCTICEFKESVTVHSFMRRTDKCKSCASKLKWIDREDEFFDICESLDIIPEYIKYSKIIGNDLEVTCLKCNFTDTRSFNNLVYRKAFECSNCSDRSGPFNRGKKIIVDGIIFDSSIELAMYVKLVELGLRDKIKVHVPYSTILKKPNLQYVSDFLVGKLVIEVTTFVEKYHEAYYDKIRKKQEYLKGSGYSMLFINTLAGVENLSIQDIVYSL